MAITSQLGYSRIGEVVIADWKEAGLLKASTIKSILATIERSLVVRTLGKLNQRDLVRLKDALKAILG